MAIRRFLGGMEEEILGISEPVAWMGCRYSPETGEIRGLPEILVPGSMVVLTDKWAFPVGEMGGLCVQLSRAVKDLSCCALLLDFQKPVCRETAALAEALVAVLPCPVILPPALGELGGPVFLPPAPLDVSLGTYLEPWVGREIWLELALDGLEITLTETGSHSCYLPHPAAFEGGHREDRLHCHYKIETAPDRVRFTLRRTREDVEALVQEAEGLGVAGCVGLWQELE